MKKRKKAKSGKATRKDLGLKRAAAEGVKGGITNVRANASAIGGSSTTVPSSIVAF